MRKNGWQVVENCGLPKDPDQGSEDDFAESEHCFVLADGHSNHGQPIDGLTPAQYIVKAGLQAFKDWRPLRLRTRTSVQNLTVQDEAEDLVQKVSSVVRNALEDVDRFNEIGPHDKYRRPGFVLVAFLPELDTIVRVGDCQFFLNEEGHNPGLEVDHVKTALRVRMLEGELAHGTSEEDLLEKDPSKELMRYLTTHWQHQHRNSNSARGYGVIDGTEVPSYHIKLTPVPAHIRRVTLTTDGFPPFGVKGTFSETEDVLREVLAEDRLCIRRWPGVRGVNKHGNVDDRTYVRLERVN